MRSRNQTRRGATLIEVMTASSMTVVIIGAAVAMMLSGSRSWAQGESYIAAELNGQQAMKRIAQDLREAMSVTVSTDGRSVTYRLPRRDGNGSFITPAVLDPTIYNCYVVANERGRYDLFIGPVGGARRISSNVVLTDPEGINNPVYRPFTPGLGTVTRQITLMVVTQTASLGERGITHRVRERIVLRNVPSTTR